MFDIELFEKEYKLPDLFSEILYYEDTISSNATAKEISENRNMILVCDYQSGGKGRFDRKWESEKGKNLLFTLKMSIDIRPEKNSSIAFFFSYCVFSGIVNFIKKYYPAISTEPMSIKWPNDILWNDSKICGLLIETKGSSNEFIIGVGINVNQKEFPSLFKASSLSNIIGNQLSREYLLCSVIQEVSLNFDLIHKRDYVEIFRLWKNSTKMIGRSCSFSKDGNTLSACKVIDLHEDGSIELMINEVMTRSFSGDIKLLVNY